MYHLFKSLYLHATSKEEYSILVLGLDGAGKTTFLEQIKALYNAHHEPNLKTVPTVGQNVSLIDLPDCYLKVWDVGGQHSLRGLWQSYYSSAHAIVFVVDSTDIGDADVNKLNAASASSPTAGQEEEGRLGECKLVLEDVLENEDTEGVPVLVLANKQDREDCVEVVKIKEGLVRKVFEGEKGSNVRDSRVLPMSALSGTGVREAVEWLCSRFTHGVASGDPFADSVILWTRASPIQGNVASNASVEGYVPLYNHGGVDVSTAPVCVEFKVARTADFSEVESSGTAYTSSDIDYTVKVEAANLTAYTRYYYQFNICGSNNTSPLGRTKTTPAKTDYAAEVGIAVYSCSNYPFGFFNAYGNPARKDSVDYVIHLGDYIYEYAGNGDYGYGQAIDRVPQPEKVIYTLSDYRQRLATYREDLDLLLSHQNFPWIPVWDDHDVADNTYRDGEAELNNTEASFVSDGGVSVEQRKMNAVRAYFEWLPIRQVEMDDNLRVWRSFSFGSLFDLVMLDTRQYDRSITDLYWNTDYIHTISNDAGRTLMGSRQENWFYNQLSASANRGARWRVIGSQIVFSRVNESMALGNVNPLNYDAWDGYQANRNRTLNHLYQNKIGNNIMLSGDSHASWVSDLVWLDHANYSSETGAGSIGVEFGGSAVSSPCPWGQNITIDQANNYSDWLEAANPELHWNDLYYRGYYELHIGYDSVNASFFGMPTIVTRNPYEISLANFTVISGENKLSRPISDGVAEAGSLKDGMVVQTNITNNTETGMYFISHAGLEDI